MAQTSIPIKTNRQDLATMLCGFCCSVDTHGGYEDFEYNGAGSFFLCVSVSFGLDYTSTKAVGFGF